MPRRPARAFITSISNPSSRRSASSPMRGASVSRRRSSWLRERTPPGASAGRARREAFRAPGPREASRRRPTRRGRRSRPSLRPTPECVHGFPGHRRRKYHSAVRASSRRALRLLEPGRWRTAAADEEKGQGRRGPAPAPNAATKDPWMKSRRQATRPRSATGEGRHQGQRARPTIDGPLRPEGAGGGSGGGRPRARESGDARTGRRMRPPGARRAGRARPGVRPRRGETGQHGEGRESGQRHRADHRTERREPRGLGRRTSWHHDERLHRSAHRLSHPRERRGVELVGRVGRLVVPGVEGGEGGVRGEDRGQARLEEREVVTVEIGHGRRGHRPGRSRARWGRRREARRPRPTSP